LGNIPRHAQSPGDYFQKPMDGSQLGTTPKAPIPLPGNTLRKLKEVAQTMQMVMQI
jgi:hypothetical protein